MVVTIAIAIAKPFENRTKWFDLHKVQISNVSGFQMVGFQIPTCHLLLVVKGKYPFFEIFTWVVGSTNKSSSRAADFLPLAPEDFGADFGAALGVALGAGSLALLAGPMKRKNTQVSNPYFYYVLSSVVFSLSIISTTKKLCEVLLRSESPIKIWKHGNPDF